MSDHTADLGILHDARLKDESRTTCIYNTSGVLTTAAAAKECCLSTIIRSCLSSKRTPPTFPCVLVYLTNRKCTTATALISANLTNQRSQLQGRKCSNSINKNNSVCYGSCEVHTCDSVRTLSCQQTTPLLTETNILIGAFIHSDHVLTNQKMRSSVDFFFFFF